MFSHNIILVIFSLHAASIGAMDHENQPNVVLTYFNPQCHTLTWEDAKRACPLKLTIRTQGTHEETLFHFTATYNKSATLGDLKAACLKKIGIPLDTLVTEWNIKPRATIGITNFDTTLWYLITQRDPLLRFHLQVEEFITEESDSGSDV